MKRTLATLAALGTIWATAVAAVPAASHEGSMDRHLAPDDYRTRVVKILRTNNKAQTNSYVPVVFDFEHVNPYDVIRFLRRPVEIEEGVLFTYARPDAPGGKALFCVPQYMTPSLAELVEVVDRPGLTTSAGDKGIYYPIKHRRCASSTDGVMALGTALSASGEVVADPETNSFFIYDMPSISQAVATHLEETWDKPTAMVQLEVKIYEVDAYNDGALGLDYLAWKNGPGRNLFAVGAFAESAHIDALQRPVYQTLAQQGAGQGQLPGRTVRSSGANMAYAYDFSSAFFDFLAVKGKARLLNEAKLAALNTHSASMITGDQVLYYAVNVENDPNAIRDYADGGPFSVNSERSVTGELTAEQTGIALRLIPTIGEQSVDIEIILSWADVNGFDDRGIPSIHTRGFATTLNAPVGEEIVLGGLQRQALAHTTEKVPILGSLPVLGWLFGGESVQSKHTEVVVVVRPAVVMDYSMAGDYGVGEDAQETMARADGRAEIAEPATTFGFDMWGLDAQ